MHCPGGKWLGVGKRTAEVKECGKLLKSFFFGENVLASRFRDVNFLRLNFYSFPDYDSK
jgi:hypothetical protein